MMLTWFFSRCKIVNDLRLELLELNLRWINQQLLHPNLISYQDSSWPSRNEGMKL